MADIDSISLDNLDVFQSLKNANSILELLDTVSNQIISSINEKYCIFYQSVNGIEFIKTPLKRVDTYKDSIPVKIKEIRREVWDDHWDFVKIAANLMDDIPDYKNSKIEFSRSNVRIIPGYGEDFDTYQVTLQEKRLRKFKACQNRLQKNIDILNKKIATFNTLRFHLSQNNICYKKLIVNSSAVTSEFGTLISDYQEKVVKNNLELNEMLGIPSNYNNKKLTCTNNRYSPYQPQFVFVNKTD